MQKVGTIEVDVFDMEDAYVLHQELVTLERGGSCFVLCSTIPKGSLFVRFDDGLRLMIDSVEAAKLLIGFELDEDGLDVYCEGCGMPMTRLAPRPVDDPQPTRYVERYRCDEPECELEGRIVEEVE